jgi:hypothetical protein
MKTFRKTFLRLFFLVAVLTCLGIDTYSNSSFHTYSIEFSGEYHKKSANSIAKDNDTGNHDQIPHKYKFSFVEEPACLMQVLQNPFLVSDFSASIWQPPKI